MSNSVNWLGNRVIDPGKPLRAAYEPPGTVQMPATVAAGDENQSALLPENILQQNMGAVAPETPITQEGPPPASEKGYIPYFLARNIGKNVRAEFVVGNSMFLDKTGVIIEVGVNYFVLDDRNSRTHVMCDMYSAKFITILNP